MTGRFPRGRALSVVLTLLLFTLAAGPARAAASACGGSGAQPGKVIPDVPWAQPLLDPDRLLPLANGSGQTVAVIDTGTDGTHPQLRGQVLPGRDLLRDAPDDNVDCVSHGTAVASLIAARQQPNVGLRGLAPDARILPIRVSDADPENAASDSRSASPSTVARAIQWAAGHGATVIDISPSFAVDDSRLRSAVRSALAAGVVVVAAAGSRSADPSAGSVPSYPAAYPGVIGVGAVDRTFTLTPDSATGAQVTVTAPGEGIVAATRISGHQLYGGTSIAAAFVAATAALVRQVWPTLSPHEVAAQIEATADPAASGQWGRSGSGMVNPYRALTEPIDGITPGTTPAVARLLAPQVDSAARARAAWWHRTSRRAMIGAGTTLVLLVLVTAGALAMGRGRSRDWSPARPSAPPRAVDDGSVTAGDEHELFALPTASPPP